MTSHEHHGISNHWKLNCWTTCCWLPIDTNKSRNDCLFARRINKWPVDSPHKGPVIVSILWCHHNHETNPSFPMDVSWWSQLQNGKMASNHFLTWTNSFPQLIFFITINSLRPSDAYMHQQTNHHWFRKWLFAWSAPSHYLNQCWNIVNWALRNKLQWKFNGNSYIQENASQNIVPEMVTILSRPQCVN